MNDLGSIILTVIITVALIFGAIVGVSTYFFSHKKEYVSKTRIIPEIRLTTDGKKVDTLYVYKLK